MTVGHMVTLAGVLFTIGMLGVLSRRNILIILLSLELMINAGALAFVAFGAMAGNLHGQVMVFFTITVAAAEIAVGLAVVIALYRVRETVNTDKIASLKR